MLKGKRILVTSGGTQEFIDDVRVMTNISTGKLGAIITEALVDAEAQVCYVHGRNAVMPNIYDGVALLREARTAMDAFNLMKEIVPTMDAVIHSMAVSDFTFKRGRALKLKSSDPQEFIKFMSRTITMNPKIISMVKQWNPNVFLVGFKFEVGLPLDKLIELARHSIEKNGCDMVIANDKVEMEQRKDHVAHFVYAVENEKLKGMIPTGKLPTEVVGKLNIAMALKEVMEKAL